MKTPKVGQKIYQYDGHRLIVMKFVNSKREGSWYISFDDGNHHCFVNSSEVFLTPAKAYANYVVVAEEQLFNRSKALAEESGFAHKYKNTMK